MSATTPRATDDVLDRSVIRPLGSGKYSDVFLVSNGRRSMAMRVSYYRDDTISKFAACKKRGDVAGALRTRQTDAVSVQSAFGKFTRGLLDTVSPHFVLMYCDIDTKSFVERMPLVSRARVDDLTPFQKTYNNVCFMEVFSCDLTRFLTRCRYDEATLRAVVFQVLYTIAAMQKLLPGWRHNDLSTNNVLVKKLKKPVTSSYTLVPPDDVAGPGGTGGTWYTSVPVMVALNDYDFVHAPGHPTLENHRVACGRYRVDGEPNASYDVHFFLKNVLRCVAKKSTAAFPDTTKFLKSLGLREKDRQDSEIPSLAPLVVLQNPYFEPLTRPTPDVMSRYSA